MVRKIIGYNESSNLKYKLTEKDRQIMIEHLQEYPLECATNYSCECDNI